MIILSSCSITRTPEQEYLRKFQKGKLTEDTSYVYRLPYKAGTSHLVVQGYYSRWSHRNRAAIDFKMPQGTEVHAARDGVVIRVIESNDKGGLNKKYRQFANLIVIQHADNSRSGYWHLKKDGAVVNPGDSVKTGQLLGYSGNTGYTAFPHLHFIAWKAGSGSWTPTGTRFLTRKGPRYLRPFHRYRNGG